MSASSPLMIFYCWDGSGYFHQPWVRVGGLRRWNPDRLDVAHRWQRLVNKTGFWAPFITELLEKLWLVLPGFSVSLGQSTAVSLLVQSQELKARVYIYLADDLATIELSPHVWIRKHIIKLPMADPAFSPDQIVDVIREWHARGRLQKHGLHAINRAT